MVVGTEKVCFGSLVKVYRTQHLMIEFSLIRRWFICSLKCVKPSLQTRLREDFTLCYRKVSYPLHYLGRRNSKLNKYYE